MVCGGPLLLMVLSSPSLGGKEDEVGEGEGRGRLFCPSLVCSCCWASSCGAAFIHLLVAGVSQLKLDVKSNFMQRKKVNISNRFEIRERFFFGVVIASPRCCGGAACHHLSFLMVLHLLLLLGLCVISLLRVVVSSSSSFCGAVFLLAVMLPFSFFSDLKLERIVTSMPKFRHHI